MTACNIAAGLGDTAAGILDERADAQIRADLGGLLTLGKLAVAVVHHDHSLGIAGLYSLDHLCDLLHGVGGAQGVAAGALNVRDFHAGLLHSLGDGGQIGHTVFQQIHLRVIDAVILQRADALLAADADDFLEGIIGSAGDGKQRIAGAQNAKQRNGQRMGTGNKVMTNQRILGAEHICVNGIQCISAAVTVAVAGGTVQERLADAVLLERGKHLQLVVLSDGIQLLQRGTNGLLRFQGSFLDKGVYAEKFVGIHRYYVLLFYIDDRPAAGCFKSDPVIKPCRPLVRSKKNGRFAPLHKLPDTPSGQQRGISLSPCGGNRGNRADQSVVRRQCRDSRSRLFSDGAEPSGIVVAQMERITEPFLILRSSREFRVAFL